MDLIIDFFQAHPFFFGLCIGLLVAFFFWMRGAFASFSHERQVKDLKESLYTKLQVETKGQTALVEELERLKTQNENLRVTVKTLQQKPDRAEIRQFHVFDKAIRSLLARSPGFGPAWEMSLKEAEQEMAETETGLKGFVRRVFYAQPIAQLTGKSPPELESETEKDGGER